MPIVGAGVFFFFFLPTADARHSVFSQAHFKTQHSCLLYSWAPERGGEGRGEQEKIDQNENETERERGSRKQTV